MKNIRNGKKSGIVGLLLVGITALFSGLSSCEKYTYEPPGIDNTKVYSFTTDIEPIFKNCAQCHKAGAQPPDLSAGNAYQALIDGNYINKTKAEDSKLLKKLYNGHGGVNSTSPKYIDLLGWITQGSKKN